MGLPIRRTATLLTLLLCLAGAGVGAASAQAGTPALYPRMGRALGIVPPAGRAFDVATGVGIPVVYHGGPTMDTGTVTVHTIFWAPSGYSYDGAPSAGTLGYVPLIEQFFTDVAHDSGSHTNIFSMLDQYGDSAGPGEYSIAYNAQTDAVFDTDPYPASSGQCPSPDSVPTCLTDADVTHEVDHVIQTHDPSGYGLHDLWEVFLPPNVDECSTLGVCGTSEFAGYHDEADWSHGTFIYAVIIDTLIEQPPIAADDPEGNPEAENSIDTSAHETVEAMTNPEGNGWMDPNGFETADKCETGPQTGTPLGYAADGSPYDQVINGHEYDIQEIYSDAAKGCEQRSTATASGAVPIPTVALRQFSPELSGNIGIAKGRVPVRVGLARAGSLVALAGGYTRADGSWGPIALRGLNGSLHGIGDDRDELLVAYGAGGPKPDLIAVGSGGNPFNEAGWTDWYDLDTGFALSSSALAVSPCGQIGVVTVTVNGVASTPPVPECQTELDASLVHLPHVSAGSQVLLTSEDNRAVSILAPYGALVSMTVALGEPGSVSNAAANSSVPFPNSGIPQCVANLRLATVSCAGLVPHERYTLTRSRGNSVLRGRASSRGIATFSGFAGTLPLTGGDVLILRNPSKRALTILHVAHLRVAIDGQETVLAGGTCQPGDYFGAPFTKEPSSSSVGEPGATGLGTICPASGKAKGLPDATIEQTDDLSGGLTQTSIPLLTDEIPAADATVYGGFTAFAQTGVIGPHGGNVPAGATVSLSLTPAGSAQAAWSSPNVEVAGGVPVKSLPAGVYHATWVVRDPNGDTRTVQTTFVQAG